MSGNDGYSGGGTTPVTPPAPSTVGFDNEAHPACTGLPYEEMRQAALKAPISRRRLSSSSDAGRPDHRDQERVDVPGAGTPKAPPASKISSHHPVFGAHQPGRSPGGDAADVARQWRRCAAHVQQAKAFTGVALHEPGGRHQTIVRPRGPPGGRAAAHIGRSPSGRPQNGGAAGFHRRVRRRCGHSRRSVATSDVAALPDVAGGRAVGNICGPAAADVPSRVVAAGGKWRYAAANREARV